MVLECCNYVMQDHRPGSVCQACREARRQAKAAKAAAKSPPQVARPSPNSPSTACAQVEDAVECGTDHGAREKKQSGHAPGEWADWKVVNMSLPPFPFVRTPLPPDSPNTPRLYACIINM